MNILTVCHFGQTRSIFLRDYLQEKGYQVRAIGVSADREELESAVQDADVIICVHPDIEKQLRELTKLKEKRIITLDVADQSKYSKDALIKQIEAQLPIE
jgi:predicted protein tyrosine phosphatase